MLELIATIILLISIIGITTIVWRKIPVLIELSETTERSIFKNFKQKLKEKIKNFSLFKFFSSEIFIQKILSRVRVLTLRIENKIANYLQKARYESQKKTLDNYWQELKKSRKEKNKD